MQKQSEAGHLVYVRNHKCTTSCITTPDVLLSACLVCKAQPYTGGHSLIYTGQQSVYKQTIWCYAVRNIFRAAPDDILSIKMFIMLILFCKVQLLLFQNPPIENPLRYVASCRVAVWRVSGSSHASLLPECRIAVGQV